MSGRHVLQKIEATAAASLRSIPWLLLALLLTGLAWRSAEWVWRLWPLPDVPARLLERGESLSLVQARHWFGPLPSLAPPPKEAAELSAAKASHFKLLGVIAGGTHPIALLKTDKESFEVMLGERFGDGYVLHSLTADYALLLRNDQKEKVPLSLPEAPAATGPAMATNAAEAGLSKKRPMR